MPASLSPRPPEPEAEIGGKAVPSRTPSGLQEPRWGPLTPLPPPWAGKSWGGVLQWTLPFWEEASAISVD